MTNEEAINVINTWFEPMRKTLKGTLAHEFLDAVEVLEKKEIKYRWHDLRKNPNDLPTKNGTYLCLTKNGYGSFYFNTTKGWYSIFQPAPKKIAWKEIEPFDEVEE